MWKYLLTAILLFVAELIYFKIAEHFKIIDRPNKRSSHNRITLRGGGIIFYIAVLFHFLIYGFTFPWFFAGLTLIATISFADDNRPQSPKLRLPVQFLGMVLMFHQMGLFYLPWYYSLIALVICTGILNAYNFMDGINGITGGYSMVVIGALWYVNNYQVHFVDNNGLYVLLMALLVFNFFNFRTKAKCFCGDVGSFSISFIIVFLLGLLIVKTKDLTYILFLLLYGVDTILTIIHRIILHENIFKPHRKHLFQLMANELKIPHLVVSIIYMVLQALVSAGLIMTHYHYEYSVVMILLFCVVYIVFMKHNFWRAKVQMQIQHKKTDGLVL